MCFQADSEELGPRAPLPPLLVLRIRLAGHSDGVCGFAELKQSQFCLTFHSSKQSAKPWGKQVQTFKSQVTQGATIHWLRERRRNGVSCKTNDPLCQRDYGAKKNIKTGLPSRVSNNLSTSLSSLELLEPSAKGSFSVPGYISGEDASTLDRLAEVLVFFLYYNWETQAVVREISMFLKAIKGFKIASQVWKAFGFSDWLHPLAGCWTVDDDRLRKWS